MSELFDTLRFTKRAMISGFSEKQAEFQAEEIADLVSNIVITRSELKKELMKMENSIKNFQYKLCGIILSTMTAVITIIESLFHLVLR
jgi:hypothetical protein